MYYNLTLIETSAVNFIIRPLSNQDLISLSHLLYYQVRIDHNLIVVVILLFFSFILLEFNYFLYLNCP